MTCRESDIVHENGKYWVLRVAKGFQVLRVGITHSVVCAHIGFTGGAGLTRAIMEVDRRIEADLEKERSCER